MTESKDDFVADDFQPDTQDDFVADDFTPDTENKPEKSSLEKGARIGAQYALGRLEGTPAGIVYDIGVSPANSKSFGTFNERVRIGEDLEWLYDKNAGKPLDQWSKPDQELYASLEEQIRPGAEPKYVQEGVDLSIRGLAEKATGQDLHPEGVWEKAASWAGFVKNPKNVKSLKEIGTNPKEIAKAILPYPHEIFRGIGAGTAMQMAEDGQWGPLGHLGAAIVGDIVGHTPKGIYKIAANPKAAAAKAVNLLTMNNTQRQAATQLIEDFNKSGLQVDAGTLTGSPLVQMMQARLTQSGLTGNALDNFRKELSAQITREYENTIADLGELTFENNHQASEAIKNALKVEEVQLNAINKGKPAEQQQQAAQRSPLQGRIAVEERPNYQQQLLDTIAPEPTPNSYQGGENLKTAAEDIRQPIKEEFNQRFTAINEELAGIEAGPQQRLVAQLENFVNEHQGSLLLGESAAEARVLQTADRLLQRLRPQGGFRGVTLDELIKTRRTLADVANWEMATSDFTSAYRSLVGDINAAIERAIGNNPELRNAYLELNADYEAYKNAFEDKNLRNLYNPKNYNYNSIYKEFVNSPDKLRSLEDIFHASPRGEQLVNQIKRDYAQDILNKSDITARDIADLQQVLGPEFDGPILDFIRDRQQALEHPLPRAAQRQPLGINAPTPQTTASKGLKGRNISETSTERAKTGLRKKVGEALEGKKPDEVMSEMNTVEGIRKLRRALETTSEGKKLFKELSRFKLAELIDNKMKDAVSEQVKLGKFSNLLSTKKSRDIVKELLSPEAFKRLELLQLNSGRLAQSAGKFFNASQSGTTLTDMGLVGAAASGIMLGNPFMAVPALLKIGGGYTIANLFSDPVFLKELERAILTKNDKKFMKILEDMRPRVTKALKETQRLNEEKD